MPRTVSEALLEALAAHGAREIFGIPGDFALPFFKVIEKTGILPLYTLSHEPAIGFAADAAARLHGGLGVAAVTYGAGALNMVNPVAGAYAEKSPLVVISGAPGRDEGRRGLLLHHQAKTLDSQLRVFREVTCDQAVLDDPRRAPHEIARVLRSCREHSRPVYLELPRDMVLARCDKVSAAPPTPVDADAVRACAGEILDRVRAARAPALLVGVEVRRHRCEDAVADLARRLGVPVATTFMGRGLLAETDVPLLGTYLGVAGNPELTEVIEGADCLLMLGVIVSDTNFGVSGRRIDVRRSVIAADREVRLGFHVYPLVPLPNLVAALLDALPPTQAGPAKANAPRVREAAPDDAPITPDAIAAAVNDLFLGNGVMPIAADMGDCLFTAMDMAHSPMVAPGYYATMGFGVPAGLGVQAATGRRPLVLVGDGAFQMTGWELGNCRRYGWDPIVLLFNNAGWEMLRTFQPETAYNDLDD